MCALWLGAQQARYPYWHHDAKQGERLYERGLHRALSFRGSDVHRHLERCCLAGPRGRPGTIPVSPYI
jgi:hypothetical protein